jgi:hypothetical protein
MQLQDLVLLAHFIFFNVMILRAITGPRHVQTHILIVVTALFTPFIAFDWTQFGAVPAEAWIFCGAFVVIQAIHTAFHLLRPTAIHAHGPEILFQPLICLWVVELRYTLAPSLWYRGSLGLFVFCLETLFLSLGVLMFVYISRGTSIPDDMVDVKREPLTSEGNAAFFAASAAALMLTLFVVFRSPLWLLASVVAFAVVRALLGPELDTGRSSLRSTAEPR